MQPRTMTNTTKALDTKHEFMIKGAKIIVHESGHGMPVLFLHGSPDTHDMWISVIERLHGQTNVRAIAPDMPGFGESMLPDTFSLSLDNFADFMRDLIDALHIDEPVVLVGTDFGGHYAFAFATKYPERVRGLVASATQFFSDYQWHSFAKLYRIPVIGELLLGGTSKKTLDSAMKGFAPKVPQSYLDSAWGTGFGSKHVRKTILRMYRERDSHHFKGWEDKFLAALQNIPTLVLWGDKDPFISPAFAERFDKAQVHHFPEHSHWLPLEAPDQYTSKLLAWLATV